MFGPRDRRGTSKEKVDVESLEQENDKELDRLSEKVSLLKSISHSMNKEADDQHKLLDNMDGSFMNTRGLMGAVSEKFRVVYNDKANKQLIYGVVGGAAVLFLLWYMFNR